MNESKAYELIEYVWDNMSTSSYLRINHSMIDAVMLAIKSGMAFESSDLALIYTKMRGGYWFGVNSNGKGMGEMFYESAIMYKNNSAIQSYEHYAGIKPFILENNRVCRGCMFFGSGLRYNVTGFDKSIIYLVGYDYKDHTEKGKKKLIKLTNKDWLTFRKDVVVKF